MIGRNKFKKLLRQRNYKFEAINLSERVRIAPVQTSLKLISFLLFCFMFFYYKLAIHDKDDIYWAMIAAFATIALALLAYYQLNNISETSRADFAHKFKNDFFNERTRELFTLFEYDLLELCEKKIHDDTFFYFRKRFIVGNSPESNSAVFLYNLLNKSIYDNKLAGR